jgi:chromate transport protein ChrA
MAEVIPYILGLFVGLHYFGITGAAVANTLRVVADCLILMHLCGNLKQNIGQLQTPLLFMFLALCASMAFPPESILLWVSSLALISSSVFWSFKNMPSKMREFLYKVKLVVSGFF